ncbi:M23 family metallopeptidase [Arsenicicoccus sp. oral taxon 190]|uniref:M23 family metallopeptidase n=1 Tax=Arsenicicoccus sp. oral taxon 190 TaxID=1658671 RepID=UPI00067A408B|nr:M23 family metallopeptidase [Arsenicicoccus sp. oral taxon 190]AKT51460.1 hypothetical protein ADJ73_09275 [Arsenicicoccus sp. oral taxon 190]
MSHRLRARALRGSLALACALTLAAPTTASAFQLRGDDDTLRDRQAQVQDDLASLRGQLTITSADLAQAYTALTQAQAQLPGARSREATAVAALAEAQRRDTELAGRLRQATADETDAAAALERSQESLAKASGRMGQVAAEMQDPTGGQLDQIGMLVDAKTPDELYSRYSLLETVGSLQARDARDLATVRADATAKEARLQAVRDEVARLKAESAANVTARSEAQAQAQAARAQVEQLVAQSAQAKAAVESRKAAEQQRLTQLDAEASALSAELADRERRRKAAEAAAAAERARQARAAQQAQEAQEAREAARRKAAADAQRTQRGQAPAPQAPAPAPAAPAPDPAPPAPAPDLGGGRLSRPAVGPITSPYGMRFHPVLHYTKLHTGTDFGIPCGTPVYAAADGSIISAGFNVAYGNRVVIDHGTVDGADLATTYNHLTSISVYGGHVSRGQLLGYSGTTGFSTGCHLHFETLVDGRFQDPMRWL